MRIDLKLSLFALTLALLPSHARAASIGVNFGDPSYGGALAAGTSAGVAPYTQIDYNNVASTPTNLALHDDSGTTTSALLSITSGANFSANNPNASGADEVLNNEMVFNGSGATLTLTLTDIPYASYALVVYDLANAAGAVQSITLGNVVYYTSSPDPEGAGYVDNNSATPYTYTQGTSTSSASPTADSDYVVFTGLSGTAQTINETILSSNTGLVEMGGFQIIEVPEPSTWAVIGLGAALLGVTLRQRRRARLD